MDQPGLSWLWQHTQQDRLEEKCTAILDVKLAEQICRASSNLSDVFFFVGAVAERLKATVLKTVIPKGIGGSNPSCSVQKIAAAIAVRKHPSLPRAFDSETGWFGQKYCV